MMLRFLMFFSLVLCAPAQIKVWRITVMVESMPDLPSTVITPTTGTPCPDAGKPGVAPNCTMVGTLTSNGCSALTAPWTPVDLTTAVAGSPDYVTMQKMIADKVTYQISKVVGCVLPKITLVGVR